MNNDKTVARYENPMSIVARFEKGETQGLQWSIREFIYLSIKSREAHGQSYYETPSSIARKFGCATQNVHEALRDEHVVIRTGAHHDKDRKWIVCTDETRRTEIKSGYKHAGKKASGQNPEETTNSLLGKTQKDLGKAQKEPSPILSGQNPEHEKIPPNTPLKETFKTPPAAARTGLMTSTKGYGTGDGTQDIPVASPSKSGDRSPVASPSKSSDSNQTATPKETPMSTMSTLTEPQLDASREWLAAYRLELAGKICHWLVLRQKMAPSAQELATLADVVRPASAGETRSLAVILADAASRGRPPPGPQEHAQHRFESCRSPSDEIDLCADSKDMIMQAATWVAVAP